MRNKWYSLLLLGLVLLLASSGLGCGDTYTTKADLPAGAISWDKAKDHIGDRTTTW